jgi:ABC-type uncharacterized transport system permease subunit
MFMRTIKRHVLFGAIGGAVFVVALVALAGIFIVMFAGTAGALVGAVLGFVVGLVRAPFSRGRKVEVQRPPA